MPINQLLQNRRSIYPKTYTQQPIERETVERLLQAANLAPNHKRTEPWRFYVFHSLESRTELAAFYADFYTKNTPADQFSETKLQKGQQNCLRSACAIVTCVNYNGNVPAHEEEYAVACAIQNILLQATHENLGAFWSTGGPTKSPAAWAEFLGLPDNQKCLGVVFVGHHELPLLPSSAGDWREKVVFK